MSYCADCDPILSAGTHPLRNMQAHRLPGRR